jgi:uracil-DNA glycosylase
MLAALRLTRADAPAPHQVFVTNALKCRLPDHRNPLPEQLAACEGHLVRQIELLRPAVIVVVGRFAAQSLLRTSEPVGRLRARAHAFHGVPLVVTHDPAVLLRHPELKPRAWEDLCLAAELADSAGVAGADGLAAPAPQVNAAS